MPKFKKPLKVPILSRFRSKNVSKDYMDLIQTPFLFAYEIKFGTSPKRRPRKYGNH